MLRHLISDAHEWINENPVVPTHGVEVVQMEVYGNSKRHVYGCELQPYLEWMEKIRNKCVDVPLMIRIIDANAVSPLWHSKVPRREGWDKVFLSEQLKEFVAQEEFLVLNQPCQLWVL
ncbi:Retrovirus-related Pol polyprotein from type-1 retrotransposable element R1-like Protein [Tribolium castaneum]|uniref:Retrovirus-related Pol polyprotein from type-1 retrotransposable element R1-like Protein n=1 Tax=Tribolium castaneum TaxID=7070 RepID=D7EKR2_TRICA|nr:Retrovirus-related Pol polyprotein from type-1 retrotransposable element R1-like Protein [Tribolium castaneum]